MANVKRIVCIVPDTGEGGLFQFYNQLIPALARHAEIHVVFASPTHVSSTPSISGARCHVVHAEAARSRVVDLMDGPLALAPTAARAVAVADLAWETAAKLEPDCVEVCDWPLAFAPAVFAQKLPYVVQCHGSMGQLGQHDPQPGQGLEGFVVQLIESQLMNYAHRVQTYSTANAAFWQSATNGPVELIRPAFALPDLRPLHDPVSDRAAVFGRLQIWKGPHILCDALRILGSQAPSCDWYGAMKPWGGSGLAADKFLQSNYSEIWGNRFFYHPNVPRTEVADIQTRALFNVVPSTWDVFNFTAVEAMAAGRPTIISTGAGASELIIDGENGFTFDNAEPESLAASIERVLSISERRRIEIAMAGRETIEKSLDPRLIARQRMSAYEAAVRSFRAKPLAESTEWIRQRIYQKNDQRSVVDEMLGMVPIDKISSHVRRRLFRKFGL